jgi:hypothetical protein
MRSSACSKSAEFCDMLGGKKVIAVREQPSAVAVQYVGEQNFGIARSDVVCGFGDGSAEGQGKSR